MILGCLILDLLRCCAWLSHANHDDLDKYWMLSGLQVHSSQGGLISCHSREERGFKGFWSRDTNIWINYLIFSINFADYLIIHCLLWNSLTPLIWTSTTGFLQTNLPFCLKTPNTKPAFIVIPLVKSIWDHCESWFWRNIFEQPCTRSDLIHDEKKSQIRKVDYPETSL